MVIVTASALEEHQGGTIIHLIDITYDVQLANLVLSLPTNIFAN